MSASTPHVFAHIWMHHASVCAIVTFVPFFRCLPRAFNSLSVCSSVRINKIKRMIHRLMNESATFNTNDSIIGAPLIGHNSSSWQYVRRYYRKKSGCRSIWDSKHETITRLPTYTAKYPLLWQYSTNKVFATSKQTFVNFNSCNGSTNDNGIVD